MRKLPPLKVVSLLLTVLTAAAAPSGGAQDSLQASHLETASEFRAAMTPAQLARWTAAAKLFDTGDFTSALHALRALQAELPADAFLAKYTAEAAIDTGDYPYALQLISPILEVNPDDWQAHTLRARLAAQTADAPERDRQIAQLALLRSKGIVPQKLRQYPIERVKVGDQSLLIFQSLFPWGNFKVQNYAQLFDSTGKMIFRMTLESDDIDQVTFAKEHPEQAAAGERVYSYDGYRDNGTTPQGQHSETHMAFSLGEKKQTYDQVRARFIQIAEGQSKPASSTTHPLP
jgi:tetratricopeptide (TPR) repeat protein